MLCSFNALCWSDTTGRTDVSSTVTAPGNVSGHDSEWKSAGTRVERTVGPEVDLAVVGEATVVLLESVVVHVVAAVFPEKYV